MKSRTNRRLRRSMIGLAAFAGLAMTTLAASPAAAQGTPEQRAACQDDAMRLCGHLVPNVDAITSCMQGKRRLVSAGCRRVMSGGSPKRRVRSD